MNFVQKAVGWMLRKSIGFAFNTTNVPRSVLDLFGNVGQAEGLAVVYGCARIRAQIIGSVPLHLFREKRSGTKVKADDESLYDLLHASPNEYTTSMELRANLERSWCLWGNGYSHVNRMDGRIVSFDWLPPDRVRPKLERPRPLYYAFTDYGGKYYEYPYQDILHVRNFSNDGITGISPLLQYVMEHALAAQSFSSNFLKNAGRLSSVVQHTRARPTSDDEVEKYKASFQADYAGPQNAGKTLHLWNGETYAPISVPPDEAQLIETARKLTGDIAGSIYGVPLNLLGIESQTSTYASAEQFAIQFIRYTIAPQCKLYEQALNKTLFRPIPGQPVRQGLSVEFDLDALQRGDSAAQAAFYSNAANNGWMTRNEIRGKQNLPALPGGDELTVQSNLIPVSKLGEVTNTNQLPAAGGTQ